MPRQLDPPVSDAELIAASQTDAEAFAGLFDRHAATVFRYAARRLGGAAAEDLVGETFLVAFQRRTRFDVSYTDARPWLLGIATKLISRHHRTEAARYRALARTPPDGVAAAADERAGERVAAVATGPALARALAALPARDRDVLLLFGWAELSYVETAAALDIPVGTVRSRLNRARRAMRAALGDTNPLDEDEPE